MALDLDTLWDFSDPRKSELRFREAAVHAAHEESLVLQTQIARSYGLRKDFARAREILAAVEPQLARATPEAEARYHLELGRTYASGTHSKDQLTPEALEKARTNFTRAFEIASHAQLDGLAIDALHMMPFVDAEPRRQLEWDRKAIAYMERSGRPEALRWEGALRNNAGYALQLAGDHEAALEQFRLSRAAYERVGRTRNVRYADWMIARTYRAQGKLSEALAIQRALEQAWEAQGESDPQVFEELEALYRGLGDETRARHYAAKARAATAK